MDGSQFDTLTRRLTGLGSRRAVISSLVAGSFGLLGVVDAAAKKKRRGQNRAARRHAQAAAKKCRSEGHPCEGNQRDSCCSGLVCMASGPGNAERCTSCPPGDVIFEGACCSPLTTCPTGLCGSVISDQCGGTIPCRCPIGENCCENNEQSHGECIAACPCGQTFDPTTCACAYPAAGTCEQPYSFCNRNVPNSCGDGCVCGPCGAICDAAPGSGACCTPGGLAANGTPCVAVCP